MKQILNPTLAPEAAKRVTPSVVSTDSAKPFTLDQELEPFGAWVGDPIWAPPKDSSAAMAETMLASTRPFTSKEKRWSAVVDKHRAEFTQVREIDLFRASIRLPQGRFLVSVTEQQDFDQITDHVPDCVQTRLDEFLEGPGKQRGVKVYYLKPLCVDFCDELILTTRDDVSAAIIKIQEEVFSEYRVRALLYRPMQAVSAVFNASLAAPRAMINYFVKRRQKAIEAYQARLEFERRKRALKAARTHQRLRTDGCSFDDMLKLTSPLQREAVIEQYCTEQELSRSERRQLMRIAAGHVPWFMLLSMSVSSALGASLIGTIPAVVVCDPAFVAEMPGSNGVLLKIGHFDDVGGVTHIEI